MAHHGGVLIIKYDESFFQWLRDQLIMVEDYDYAGTEFCGDPNLSLPKGSQWGDIGKKEISLYDVFDILIIKWFFHLSKTNQVLSIMQMWHLIVLQDHIPFKGKER
jgi:hypothetical protein